MSQAPTLQRAIPPVSFKDFSRDFGGFSQALGESFARNGFAVLSGQGGYTPFGIETAKGHAHYDLKEFWHVGRDLPPGHRFRDHMPDNVWPDAEVPEFHETVGWLY